MATSSPIDVARRLLDRLVLRSLRARLTVAAAATIVCALWIEWGLLGAIFENHVERLLEDDLRTRLIELAGSIAIDDSGEVMLESEPTDPRYQRPAGGAYWRIDQDGLTVLRSISLWDFDFAPAPRQHLSPTGMATEMRGPNGSSVYLASRDLVLDGAGGSHRIHIMAALDIDAAERLQQSFGRQVILALGVIAAALSVGTWIQWSFGLRPLNKLRRQLARVHSGADSRMTGSFPSEIAPLVDDLNKLLGRHEDLVRRARERAGDLAHGLKTPLTIMRAEARSAERRGELAVAATLDEQINAMNRHVERELRRARMAGASAGGAQVVDTRSAVDRLVRTVQRMPGGDAIQWRNDLPGGARLKMDPDDFGEVVGNLLDNARKHARSQARISLAIDNGRTWICFDDDGPGIPAEERERIVARGVQAGDGEGFGLGLAIVIELLGHYGLPLTIADSPWGGCRVAFPSASDPAPAVRR
jgi:signal transduction histidine kinase